MCLIEHQHDMFPGKVKWQVLIQPRASFLFHMRDCLQPTILAELVQTQIAEKPMALLPRQSQFVTRDKIVGHILAASWYD